MEEKQGQRVFTGRRRILCEPLEVTAENVVDLLDRSNLKQSQNAADCAYLHDYFLGRQPVLDRVKEVRPDIRNVVVENRAYQICKDRADALAGEPIAYSAHANGRRHGDDVEAEADRVSHAVQMLNDCCTAADKHACDLELVQWMCECGVGYRLVLPTRGLDEEMPFRVFALDPRCTFVVYSNEVSHDPLYAVTSVKDQYDVVTHTVYTASRVFTIRDGHVLSESPNPLGVVPIVEYDANPERMGVFEAVLTIFDAINEVESNRVDGIAQFVQSLMVLENVDLDAGKGDEAAFADLMRMGCLKIKSTDDSKASVQLLTAELNQDQTQTLVDALYKTALSICGMPFNVGGSASTSDTGAAVTMRDGWSNSESRCKEAEAFFRRSESRFVRIAVSIMRAAIGGFDLRASDVDVKFTRRNYEAIQSKTQVLTTLLGSGKVHPRLAFEHCGMFPDPEAAYDLSQQYSQEQERRAIELATTAQQGGGDKGGSSSEESAGVSESDAGEGKRPPKSKRSQEGKTADEA